MFKLLKCLLKHIQDQSSSRIGNILLNLRVFPNDKPTCDFILLLKKISAVEKMAVEANQRLNSEEHIAETLMGILAEMEEVKKLIPNEAASKFDILNKYSKLKSVETVTRDALGVYGFAEKCRQYGIYDSYLEVLNSLTDSENTMKSHDDRIKEIHTEVQGVKEILISFREEMRRVNLSAAAPTKNVSPAPAPKILASKGDLKSKSNGNGNGSKSNGNGEGSGNGSKSNGNGNGSKSNGNGNGGGDSGGGDGGGVGDGVGEVGDAWSRFLEWVHNLLF